MFKMLPHSTTKDILHLNVLKLRCSAHRFFLYQDSPTRVLISNATFLAELLNVGVLASWKPQNLADFAQNYFSLVPACL